MAGERAACGKEGNAPLCVLVRGTDHLREVNNDRVAGLAADEDVEFVEVAVDESCPSKTDDHVHQLGVEGSW